MSVDFQREEYTAALPDWTMVSTLCDGESAVKAAGKTLLPDPVVNTGETDAELADVYARYKQRALFVNAVGRTRASLVGSVFRKAPTLSIPSTIDYMSTDCDGAGVSIYQQSQSALSESLTTGRGGLLTDYPATDAPASVADMRSGMIRANIVHYKASQIINWQYRRVGGQSVLALVVLSETADRQNGFETEKATQLRELSILDGVYTVRLWQQPKDGGEFEVISEAIPRQSSGAPWTIIPFVFVGAMNNDASIDAAPLFDLACVNRKHYQLGADWYNALYYSGQPQPVISGLTEDWRDWLEKNGIVVGSRAPFLLPEGGQFTYATVPADTAIQVEMDKLKAHMVELGARLIQPGEATKTATQAAGEQEVSHSIVSLAAENVSDAYTQALEWALMYMGGSGEVEYRLSNDLAVLTWDAPTIAALIQGWQSGTMPKSDVQRFLQRVGLIDAEKTQEQINEETDTGGVDLSGS